MTTTSFGSARLGTYHVKSEVSCQTNAAKPPSFKMQFLDTLYIKPKL
jgi:hypothetical protein